MTRSLFSSCWPRVCQTVQYTRSEVMLFPHLPLESAQLLHHPIQQRHDRVHYREAAQGLLQLRHHHADMASLSVDVLLSCPEALVQGLIWDLSTQESTSVTQQAVMTMTNIGNNRITLYKHVYQSKLK